MLLDPSVSHQAYIEDCEVCCNPINIRYTVEDNELIGFEADSIEQ
ncbi:MAG: CPXCG motif-containing cysteine-rich protein [Cytophagales bacterium]|nr:CPXCG motif-containing cysteine-rich protein [Cytophagales bacterium]